MAGGSCVRSLALPVFGRLWNKEGETLKMVAFTGTSCPEPLKRLLNKGSAVRGSCLRSRWAPGAVLGQLTDAFWAQATAAGRAAIAVTPKPGWDRGGPWKKKEKKSRRLQTRQMPGIKIPSGRRARAGTASGRALGAAPSRGPAASPFAGLGSSRGLPAPRPGHEKAPKPCPGVQGP